MESTRTTWPTPPWDMERAAQRLTFEEAAWNAHDPGQILQGYSDNIDMRDGTSFIKGKAGLEAFLQRTFEEKLDYKVRLDLWGALKGRMAVRYEAEWHDASGRSFKSYGVQVFQFDDAGLAEKRYASYNVEPA